jgi:hypothetical protein
MIKTVLYLPIADNARQPFTKAEWKALEDRLAQFGGYSTQVNIRGVWVDEGVRYEDENWAYTVALQSVRQLPAWVEVVEWALDTFRQEALYVELNGAPDIVRKQST